MAKHVNIAMIYRTTISERSVVTRHFVNTAAGNKCDLIEQFSGADFPQWTKQVDAYESR
jgi:hypothetical protein